MTKKLVVGTRKSKLALAQTQLVIDAIRESYPEVECEMKSQSTMGDKVLDRSLVSFGGKGIFIEEFEQKIIDGEIDMAVHSAKDMPANLLEGLEIAAVLPREDARDVLIWRKENDFEKLTNPIIGTGSKRREMQIKRLYPCECRLLRGNINTRLEKLENGEYDAIILAVAGLKRLQLFDEQKFAYRFLDIHEMIPSGGQGVIAVEAMEGGKSECILKNISDKNTYLRLQIERYVLENMKAGCHEPIGVYSELDNDKWRLYVMDGRSGGAHYYSDSVDIASDKAHDENNILQKGYQLADKILADIADGV